MATSDTSMYDANAVFSFELHKRDAAAIFCSYKRLFRFIVPAHQPVIFFFGEKKEKKNGFRRKTGTMDNLVMLATDIKIRFNKKKEIYYNVNYQTNYKDARKEGIPNENTEIF
jgi:hypothetical protein